MKINIFASRTKTLHSHPRSKSAKRFTPESRSADCASANAEALPPPQNIDEAKKYFSNLVDLYI